MARADTSTGVFSSSPRRLAATSRATRRYGSVNRWSVYHGRGNFTHTVTKAFGSRWIPCATKFTSRSSGPAEGRLGRFGRDDTILARQEGFYYWTHGI